MDDARLTLLKQALAGRDDVRLALLFGSHARGRARPESDVDLAVDAPDVDLLALAHDLALAIGAEVDLLDLARATIPLVEEIVRDGIVVRERSPGLAARWRSHALASLEIDRPWYDRMCRGYLRRLASRSA